MIEYKAYHKKSLGKRMRPHAARKKKKKGKEASPGRSRFRQAIPIAAVALVILLLGAAGAAAYSWLRRSDIFSVRRGQWGRVARTSLWCEPGSGSRSR